MAQVRQLFISEAFSILARRRTLLDSYWCLGNEEFQVPEDNEGYHPSFFTKNPQVIPEDYPTYFSASCLLPLSFRALLLCSLFGLPCMTSATCRFKAIHLREKMVWGLQSAFRVA